MEIRKVLSKKDMMRFVTFPHQLYKNNENYVPTLNILAKRMLNNKNPFLKHSEIALFLAIEKDVVVGRIAAIYNKTHLDIYNDNTGFFGFFDTVNDVSVAKLLFDTCENWLKNKGLTKIIGPTNLTTNDSCGLLVEGFQYPPMVVMPYNDEYYNRLCLQSDYKKLIDLNSYIISDYSSLEKYNNILLKAEETMKSKNIIIRNVSSQSFNNDMKQLRLVYNKVNEDNWGFIPLNEEEFDELASELKITPWDLTLVVEKDGEILGFLIAIPNLNQAFKYVKNGKLFPFGIFRFLQKKRKVDSARIMILGVLDDYRGKGIDFVMYKRIAEALSKRGIFSVEACYVLENNQRMNPVLSKLLEGIIKRYRIYEKEIGG